MRVAIVTGASSGLGWEYAKQLAPRREVDEVWVIARREERLERLCGDLVGAEGRPFAVDLTDDEQLATLFERYEAEGPQVTWLVNNAGFGKRGPFESVPVETNLNMIDLNVRSLTEITQRTLPWCGDGTRILQVASSAGFAPLGNLAVYAATKAYVLHFSNALAAELEPRGIHCTAVCPGPVATEFQSIAYEDRETSYPEGVIAKAANVVRRSIADARKGRLNSVYGVTMKVWAAISGVLPRRIPAWTAESVYESGI